jgi:uncharacterized protein
MKYAIGCLVGLCMTAISTTPSHAQGPSFNCSKAATPIEKRICSSERLSRLDRDMAEAYRSLERQLGKSGKATLLESQRAWLSQRDGCGDNAACLSEMMSSRIAALKDGSPGSSERVGDLPSDIVGHWRPYSDFTSPDGVSLSQGVADFGRNGLYQIEQVRPDGWVFEIVGRSQGAIELMCGNEHAKFVSFMPTKLPSSGPQNFLEYQFTDDSTPLPEPMPSRPMQLLQGAYSMAYYHRP